VALVYVITLDNRRHTCLQMSTRDQRADLVEDLLNGLHLLGDIDATSFVLNRAAHTTYVFFLGS
jgi:hypothetical protein